MRKLINSVGNESLSRKNALTKKQIITVLVENESDIPFWKYAFDLQGLTTEIRPNPFDTDDGTRGKVHLLDLAKTAKLGNSLVLGLDSDWNYLLPNYNKVAELYQADKFIFQTYTREIENYQCFAAALPQVLLNKTLVDKQLFDLEAFLKTYSSHIHDLFVYFLGLKSEKSFSKEEFNELIKIHWVDNEIIDTTTMDAHLLALKEIVAKKIASLKAITNLQNMNKFASFGLNTETTYLFIDGHFFKDKIIKPLLNKLSAQQIKNKKQAVESVSNSALAANYKNSVEDINLSTLLASHTHYTNCFLYQKLQKDIQEFKATHHA